MTWDEVHLYLIFFPHNLLLFHYFSAANSQVYLASLQLYGKNSVNINLIHSLRQPCVMSFYHNVILRWSLSPHSTFSRHIIEHSSHLYSSTVSVIIFLFNLNIPNPYTEPDKLKYSFLVFLVSTENKYKNFIKLIKEYMWHQQNQSMTDRRMDDC